MSASKNYQNYREELTKLTPFMYKYEEYTGNPRDYLPFHT